MVKTYLKTFLRMFKRHATRLVSLVLMVLISVGFCAGIGIATDKMDYALDGIYRDKNVSDLIVKSTRASGFTDDEVERLVERYGAESVLLGASMEFKDASMSTGMTFDGVSDGVTRVYFFNDPYENVNQNVLTVTETAQRPSDLDERVMDVYVERETAQLLAQEPGKIFTATVTTPLGNMQYEFFLRGTVENPLHFATRRDISLQFTNDNGDHLKLENIFYVFDTASLPEATATAPSLNGWTNDVYIALERFDGLALGKDYDDFVHAEADAVKDLLLDNAYLAENGNANVEVLTLYENFSFGSFHEFANKVRLIGYIMMVVFLLVTLLVVLSTMTRLLEEERAQLGCLMTLGYSPMRIVVKYLLFAFIGTVIGGAGAFLAAQGLSYIIYINFAWVYVLPAYPKGISVWFFFLVSVAILLATLIATMWAGFKKTHEYPATLLRPRSPKSGKKVILERIPVLWNRLSFKYKSTLRNVLRYRVRFLMTVIAVMASTALVLAAYAILEASLFQDIGTSAMTVVAILVLAFAVMLNAVVIYTLTNINVSERERELATLMVLGYHDKEVTGYIYREVYITSSIGIVLGLPLGTLLCYFVFSMTEFGSLATMGWYVWLIAPLTSLLCVFLMTLILKRKILRIKMNDSLKAIE